MIETGQVVEAVGNQTFLQTGEHSDHLARRSRHKKVHGFAVSEGGNSRMLLLYSENEFSLYQYGISQPATCELVYEGETQDWINAATFLRDETGTQFVLHMAHSAMLRLNYHDRQVTLLELACCTDYSMLYHTSLHGHKYEELLVMSGNGFGEILVWQPSPKHRMGNPTTYAILLRLKAHNGVIFSIDFHREARLMVTTSDDRSLKFWKLEDLTDEWHEMRIKPMFSCFGHTARVFCAIIIEHGGQVYVVSGGEDSYICVWSESGEMIFKRRQQFGAPIWRLAFDASNCILYSTGATGNVLSFNLEPVLRAQKMELRGLKPIAETEFITKVKFLDEHSIVGLSNRNRLLHMRVGVKDMGLNYWQPVEVFPVYKSTILSVCQGLVATCGYQRVTLLRYDRETFELLHDGALLDGLIKSFHFLNNELFLVSDEFGNCLLLQGHAMTTVARLRISNCREPWLTAALLISPKYLLLSTRNGHVLLYEQKDPSDDHYGLKQTLKRLHGTMGSNMFKLLSQDDRQAYVLSAGHESFVKVLRIELGTGHLTLLRREYVPLTWVEAAPTADMLIGFNDNHLVVWSRQKDVLLQLPCGGGHRGWDYQLSSDGQELHIIYVKQKHVYCHRQQLEASTSHLLAPTLTNNWHIRICNILELLTLPEGKAPIIVSAGDDNIIKFHQFLDGKLRQLSELHTHISSIRHLSTYPVRSEDADFSWLIFSVGGRGQLCVNRLDLQSGGSTVVSEICSHTIRDASLDARLMAISVSHQTESGNYSLHLASADGKIHLLYWQPEQPQELHCQHQVDIKRCPLQLRVLQDNNLLLITATNGMVYGYDLTLRHKRFRHQLHDGGINSFDAVATGATLNLLTGGDDEQVRYTRMRLDDWSLIGEGHSSTQFRGLHNAQVNALTLHGGDDEATLCGYTCSMDKQIHKLDLLTGEHRRVGFTSISDIKGMIQHNNRYLYIYGCGLHVMAIDGENSS